MYAAPFTVQDGSLEAILSSKSDRSSKTPGMPWRTRREKESLNRKREMVTDRARYRARVGGGLRGLWGLGGYSSVSHCLKVIYKDVYCVQSASSDCQDYDKG